MVDNKRITMKIKEGKRYRWDIISELIESNNLKSFVEIGIGHGATASRVLKRIKDPDFRYYGIDPYVRYSGYTQDNNSKQKKINQNVKSVNQNVFTDPRAKFINNYSEAAVIEFKPKGIDIIFIDGNHAYEYVKQDLDLWYPKCKAVLCGHDYVYSGRHIGVKKAVDEFVEREGLKMILDSDNVWVISLGGKRNGNQETIGFI